MPRKQININNLPKWLSQAIVLFVVLGISVAAWFFDKDEAIPSWINNYLLPILSWGVIAIVAFLILRWLIKVIRQKL